ncbi:MAG: S9 family peptidase [Cryomorphaceae bacterium]|jgi:prolyl oligopeptidase|nr:S9 family peptidase [Cryomorphaceae bacterium]MDG1889645.1 prolyl oligopeptidase family serine peptidase [Flavobacteriaceae bacterium]MBT3503397.1 S9 family peptidase [Cryomorphaceae bacterium]MBT3688635.1 S9 family peptidase [Cryomorphaceae bacterium]MBT4222242.1 S9 family peptidase [Cryomorphaceae bacterium]
MNKFFFFLPILIISCNTSTDINYPLTEKKVIIDTYFETDIEDPYRWLEDDLSLDTMNWVNAQNEVTFDYLNSIPYRDKLKKKLTSIWNYEKQASPFYRGNYIYYYKNDGLQNQYVVYRKEFNSDSDEEVFLDPNSFSDDGTISLTGLYFSKDGNFLSYLISEGGSDWRKAIVMNTKTKEIIGDTLTNIKFSGVSWKGNEGFYYSSYDKPEGSELSDYTDRHKLYYHQLEKNQVSDKMIFGDKKDKYRYVSGSVSDDNNYLFISASNLTDGNKLFMIDLINDPEKIQTISDDESTDDNIVDTNGNTFYIFTNYDAPNKRLVKTSANKLNRNNWIDVIPESESVFSVSTGSGYFFARYLVDAISDIRQYNYNGDLIRKIDLPGLGTVSGFYGEKDQEELYFSFSNYYTPGSIYSFNPDNGEYDLYWKPKIEFNSSEYTSKQVFYESKDGTKVPMMITHKKDLVLNGKNPTILNGYGGFNISRTPGFSVSNAVWMELGGVYAVPNIRGGGEYGKKWHNSGTKLNKQNVFDDFIAAAEYLISTNYTSSDYLALIGGSNGGLLVGAVMTQRPDLMKVALPAVGVLDMLRYHKFTSGAGWAFDYGTSEESEEMFEYLLSYSPVHNVRKNLEYPATLVTTGDHDDRVVPAHSFKFAAQLQDKHVGENPVLIRIEKDAGHGSGTPLSKTIDQYSDIFGFTLYNMGIRKIK